MKEAAATTNQAFHPPSGFLVISNFFEKCSSLQVLKHLKGRIRYIISPFWIIQSDPVDTRGEKLQFCLKCDDLYDWFSIAKATLQSQMFVCLSVRSSFYPQNPSSRWKSIIHHLHHTAISEWLCLQDAPVPPISQSLQQDVFWVFTMKTWSNQTPNHSFGFCSSRVFRNIPYMLKLRLVFNLKNLN